MAAAQATTIRLLSIKSVYWQRQLSIRQLCNRWGIEQVAAGRPRLLQELPPFFNKKKNKTFELATSRSVDIELMDLSSFGS